MEIMKRYAVVGGDGMLGHKLVEFFHKNKKEVIGTMISEREFHHVSPPQAKIFTFYHVHY